jgi:putative ABC transport system permease protein
MRTFWRRIQYAIRRRRREADLLEEIEFHRAMTERDLARDGLAPGDADRATQRVMGSVLLARDQARDVWIAHWLQGLGQDLRFARRLLIKDRGFTAAAVLTLALGIGANTTIFSAVYAILLKPLPFADADRLVAIWKQNPTRGWHHNPISMADFVAWQSQGAAFDDMAIFTERSCVITGGSVAEEDPCEVVSSHLLPLLGVAPIRGRAFVAADDDLDQPRVAMLSNGLWQRRFGGDDHAIGQTLTIDGLSYTIAGVMPAGFSHAYTTPYGSTPQLWLSGIGLSPDRTWNDYLAIGRLKPHLDPRQAEKAMEPASIGLEAVHPDLKGWRAELRTLREMQAGDTRAALLVLLGAVTFVLLIACANVANLLLARGTGRTHEFVLRAALGAGLWRVVRQLLTESLLISLTGGALGLVLAWWGTRALVLLAPERVVRAAPDLARGPLDLRVLAFTLAASVATTMLFGLIAARQGATPDLAEGLKATTRGSIDPRAGRVLGALVVAQIALAMVLLIGAGLMMRTLAELRGVRLGLDPDHVITLRVPLAGDRYKDPQATVTFWRDVSAAVRVLPGVDAVSASRGVSIGDWAGQYFTTSDRPDPPAGQVPDANYVVAGADYFKALRIPVRSGRTFDLRDTYAAMPAAIVNEELVRRLWPGQEPLGKQVRMGTPSSRNTRPWMTVIGVVGNVLTQGVDGGVHSEIYVSDQQYPWLIRPHHLIIRTAPGIEPDRVISAVVREITRVDKDQPVVDIRPLDQLAGESMAQQRMVAALLAAFAGLALVLSALGIYGVLSYSVALRAREIGVRVALGARPATVLRLVIGDGGRLATIGIAAGIAAALALTRLLGDLLYGVRPTDVETFVTAVLVLGSASLLACYLPARRAVRVDPISVLRQE